MHVPLMYNSRDIKYTYYNIVEHANVENMILYVCVFVYIDRHNTYPYTCTGIVY